MSRPDELPRSASPLKRRAPSLGPDENPDASEDVDMISLPATNHDTPVADAESVQGAADQSAHEEVDANSTGVENGSDIPDLLDSLEVDRASVEETHVGSEPEDNALDTGAFDADDADDAQHQGQEQGKDKDQNLAVVKVQNLTGPSSTNSEDTAESDAKTIDTAATSASVEKSCRSFTLRFVL